MSWVDPGWGGDTFYVWPEWEVEGGSWVEEAGEVEWLVEGAEGLAAGEIGVAVAGGLAIAAVVAGPLPVAGDPEYSGFGGTARWWWDHTFGEKHWSDLAWPWEK